MPESLKEIPTGLVKKKVIKKEHPNILASQFFNSAPLAYFILNVDGDIEQVNQTGADMLQYSAADIISTSFQNYISLPDRKKYHAFLHQLQSSVSKQKIEVIINQADGNQFYAEIQVVVVRETESKFYFSIFDVTENTAIQQKLTDTAQRLQMALVASGAGSWSLQEGENKMILDTCSFSILGLNDQVFDGTVQRLLKIIHSDDRAMVRRNIINSLNLEDELNLEFRVLSESGELRNILVKGHKVRNNDRFNYAGIVLDITERKTIAKIAEAAKLESQKLVVSTTFDAQEKERNKISSILHDSICQLLYGIRLNLQNIQIVKKLTGEFSNVNKLIDQAIRETRGLSYELTPSVLRDFGFREGVTEMVQRLSNPTFIINADISNSIEKLNPEVQLYMFRIIQELINNCIKHAEATKADIRLLEENGLYTLVVSDNGQGFNKELDTALSSGSGIRGIKNRIYILDGKLDIYTSEKGTTVTVQFKNNPELC